MHGLTEEICRSVAYLPQLSRTGNRVIFLVVSELVPLAHSLTPLPVLESWGRYAPPQQISSVPEMGIQYHLLSDIVLYNLPSGKLADSLEQYRKTGD